MRITGATWEGAQEHEREHWLTFNDDEGFWLDLWEKQAAFLWPKFDGPGCVLEVGAGAWGLVRWAPKDKWLWVLDPLAGMYTGILRRFDISGLRQDISYWARPMEQYHDEFFHKFDFVLALDCLDHMDDPDKAVANICAYLKPEGYFLESTTVFEYDHPDLLNQYTESHPWVWSWLELLDLITENGFIIEEEYNEWPCHPGFKTSGSYQHLRVWRPWR